MSGPFGSSQWMYASGAEEGQSLRFEDGDSAYLARTPASAGDSKTWTWSGWVKRGNFDSRMILFGRTSDSNNKTQIRFEASSNTLVYALIQSGSFTDQCVTDAVLRDPSAWYHIVVSVDTTQATASDRVKMYVNGVLQSLATANYPALNDDTEINKTAYDHYLGAESNGTSHLDGYLANVTFIDGTALDPTSFGEYDDTLWKPKSDADITSLTFGTNGFYLPFAGDIAAGSSYYFDGSSDYVSYSSASLYDVGSSDDFELECFFNTDMVSGSGDYGYMLGNYDGSSQFMTLQPDFRSANEHFAWYTGNGQAWGWDYTSGDIKPNTWHHITISRTSGTLRMFLDGVRLTSIQSFSTSAGTISGGNVINNTTSYNLSSFRIGEAYSGQKAYKGYVSNVRFIVGSSIRNSDSNFTVPTATLTDVTNTKLLTATNITIGDDISSNNNDGSAGGNARSSGVNPFGEYDFFEDVSGNGNNWSPNNLQYTDVVLDSPVTGGNFAVMNPTDFALYLSEGNLKVSSSAGSGSIIARSTMLVPPNSGKWYFEGYSTVTSSNGHYIGVWCPTGLNAAISSGYHDDANFGVLSGHECVAYLSNGTIRNNSSSSTVTGLDDFDTAGDIVGVLLDMDAQTVQFYNNGTAQGSAQSLPNTTDPYGFFVAGHHSKGVIFNAGQDDSFAGLETPNGVSDESGTGVFSQSQGANGKAWNSGNLPTPTITAPDDYFNTVLYTGDNADRNIDVGFQSDFIWVKERNGTPSHRLYDSVRGDGQTLFSNLTNAEYDGASDGIDFSYSNGFAIDAGSNVGSYNGTSDTYVAWNWLAGNGTVSNTDGSMTSTVSANTTAGFSIIDCTTTAANSTCGHGLSEKPELVISKSRSATSDWYVLTDIIDGSSDYLRLNLTAAKTDYASSAPTATTITIPFASGVDTINYAFHSVEGYSKIGSYTGNSSSDGTFVHCGFRPAWVMVKRTNNVADWVILDNERNQFNVANLYLSPNSSASEVTSDRLDMLSNGFKLKTTGANVNYSGDNYIFLAFAESPFSKSNAR